MSDALRALIETWRTTAAKWHKFADECAIPSDGKHFKIAANEKLLCADELSAVLRRGESPKQTELRAFAAELREDAGPRPSADELPVGVDMTTTREVLHMLADRIDSRIASPRASTPAESEKKS